MYHINARFSVMEMKGKASGYNETSLICSRWVLWAIDFCTSALHESKCDTQVFHIYSSGIHVN